MDRVETVEGDPGSSTLSASGSDAGIADSDMSGVNDVDAIFGAVDWLAAPVDDVDLGVL